MLLAAGILACSAVLAGGYFELWNFSPEFFGYWIAYLLVCGAGLAAAAISVTRSNRSKKTITQQIIQSFFVGLITSFLSLIPVGFVTWGVLGSIGAFH